MCQTSVVVVAIPCWSCSEVTGELGIIGGIASTEQRVAWGGA